MFVRRDMDDSMLAVELRDIDRDGQFDLAIFEGASSGSSTTATSRTRNRQEEQPKGEDSGLVI